MGLICLEGCTSWIFSCCGRGSRLTTGTSGTRSRGLRKGQSPCELLRVLSGFLSRRCWDLRPCVESVPEPEDSSPVLEPEDSSPVLTWTLGYFWSLPRGVSLRLEWGHAPALSSLAVAAVSCSSRMDQGISGFPSRLSHDAFQQGFPTRLSQQGFQRGFPPVMSHVPPWCQSILGLKVEAVQGKQVSLEWTETSWGLWKWWHDAGVPLAFPVESASS